MKPQDFIFFVVLVILLFVRRPKYFLFIGLFCWIAAIPLFVKWIFFTGERLTWYGAAFMLAYLVISLACPDKVK